MHNHRLFLREYPPREAESGRTQGDDVRMVVDPATSQVRETNFFVTADGARVSAPGDAMIVAEWTDLLPE